MKQFLGKSPSGLFATQTLTGNVIRGAVAFALLYLAIEQQRFQPVASLLAGLLALVAMRGCPVYWTIGLAETSSQNRFESIMGSPNEGEVGVSSQRRMSGIAVQRTIAVLGSAVFFVVAPCALAGLVPWSITGWQLLDRRSLIWS